MEVSGTVNLGTLAFKRLVLLRERPGCSATATGKILLFLHLFYYKHSNFTEAKILQFKHKAPEFHAFI